MNVRRLLPGVLFVTLLVPVLAHAEFQMPPNDGLVTDAAGLLSPSEEQQLETDLRAYQTATTNEIAVVTLTNLAGNAIEDVGLQIGRKWGVGSEKNNGILLLIGYEEHAVRIEVGYGLEGAVPDIVAKGIIDTDIVPFFREAQYSKGLFAAVESLKKHIGGEYTADRYAVTETDGSGFGAGAFFALFLLFQWILAILGRSKSWWLGGVLGGIGGVILTIIFSFWYSIPILIVLGLFLDYIVSKNFHARGSTAWWAGGRWGPGGGGGFGGGSGGGFGGFGGGSFGGGGASGRW